jgi:hypothetical protein
MAIEGEVEIELDGQKETLRCTLPAARGVNAMGSGFTEVFRRLAAFDLDAYAGVVAAGLKKKPSEVEEAVYKTGLANLTEALSEFVMLLASGGRRQKPEGQDQSGEV